MTVSTEREPETLVFELSQQDNGWMRAKASGAAVLTVIDRDWPSLEDALAGAVDTYFARRHVQRAALSVERKGDRIFVKTRPAPAL